MKSKNSKKKEKLKNCPLCQSSDVEDIYYGIKCYNCGLWLGESTKVNELGGFYKVWQNRNPYAGKTINILVPIPESPSGKRKNQ